MIYRGVVSLSDKKWYIEWGDDFKRLIVIISWGCDFKLYIVICRGVMTFSGK